MYDISDWLRDCQQYNDHSMKKCRKRPRNPALHHHLQQQPLTPLELSIASNSSMGSDDDGEIMTQRSRSKRQRRDDEENRRNKGPVAATDISADTSAYTSAYTSASAKIYRQSSLLKRMLQLEISPNDLLSVTMLTQLEAFEYGNEFVPKQLAPDIQARQQDDSNADNDEFYNFRPCVFCREDDAPFWHPIDLDDVFDVLTATQISATTTTSTATAAAMITTTARLQTMSIRASCVPCTTARITGQSRGSKMVDFCIALQPDDSTTTIRELRSRTGGLTVNHTNFYALRDKLIVISAESKKPGQGLLEARTQVSVWQSAQWSLLSSQCQSVIERSRGKSKRKGKGNMGYLPFLPALFIQGSQWSFAATTRHATTHGDQTLLWAQQNIGTSDSILGIFRIIRTLRYLAEWSATVYWPWYESEVLGIGDT
ncbi:hypothetical protein F5Y12DRAFT_790103 [Xylaria sp. FL1777]|nr:hypothetical protein F5Y12DRAFT_790103 [Xylaria sp. FL1777]